MCLTYISEIFRVGPNYKYKLVIYDGIYALHVKHEVLWEMSKPVKMEKEWGSGGGIPRNIVLVLPSDCWKSWEMPFQHHHLLCTFYKNNYKVKV